MLCFLCTTHQKLVTYLNGKSCTLRHCIEKLNVLGTRAEIHLRSHYSLLVDFFNGKVRVEDNDETFENLALEVEPRF